jgi:hypothetical protein
MQNEENAVRRTFVGTVYQVIAILYSVYSAQPVSLQ